MAYNAYPQNKGTLMPGQSISVNKYSVQVERYLSQGGFAHVYLVRTPTPVYNTTHHVLKRIAVANDAMLTEVKKEVDIMRLLKGHPNIVHLIDAAWHKMPNGMYEVFILMEFCPGGGIIDMMNRRLRERLTEAEILQIFVDVCEGVACMHNSRPPLLHRDLKVENILQSTPTSFKLCDFGSATTVARPPSTTQEIRALEADLNRHTTLQYRAPEMVDPYLRRPVDEKSDVWALGVLLYKLCYYTTPFEEHGPLAILNVQYHIPPYPVYSPQMNQLIASMLQEHGIRRPSVFELLNHVHRLRGSKSRFHYTIPIPEPLSPRHQTHFKPVSVNSGEGTTPSAQPSLKPKPEIISNSGLPLKGQGVQAREKVLEAIAPMRRGRPTHSKEPASSSRSGSPQKNAGGQTTNSEKTKNWLDGDSIGHDDASWKAATATALGSRNDEAEAWKVGGKELAKNDDQKRQGFGDDFAEKLWDSFKPKAMSSKPPKVSTEPDAVPKVVASSTRVPVPSPSPQPSTSKARDAFEGLGLGISSEKQAPTLGEARKLRTGLAVTNTTTHGFRYDHDRINTNASQLTPSPRPPYLSPHTQLHPQSLPSTPPRTTGSGPLWRTSPQPIAKPQPDGLPAETRFPSLEELDATFTPGSSHTIVYHSKISPQQGPDHNQIHQRDSNLGRVSGSKLLKPTAPSRGTHDQEGVKSEQVTGVTVQEPRRGNNGRGVRSGDVKDVKEIEVKSNLNPHLNQSNPQRRPTLTRRHRSSITIKHVSHPSVGEDTFSPPTISSATTENLAPPSPRLPTGGSKDWLTGENDDHTLSTSILPSTSRMETPVLRESPSKRASFIQKSAVPIQDAVTPLHDHVPVPRRTPSPTVPAVAPISPTLSRFTRTFPSIDTTDDIKRDTVEALIENWSPVAPRAPGIHRGAESSSSADEGPEDPSGSTHVKLKGKDHEKKPRRKGRQSSVHELVGLWGGGLGPKDKERERQPVRSTRKDLETTSHRHQPQTTVSYISAQSNSNPRSASPQPLLLASSDSLAMDSDHNQSMSGGPGPSIRPRSRPQSMLIFPSKYSEGSSLPSSGLSPGLLPPDTPVKRSNSRRTSISDIVQHYEGIGAKTKTLGMGVPLSPGVPRTIGKPGPTSVENGRHSRGQVDSNIERAMTLLSLSGDSSTSSRNPTDLNRTSPIGAPTPIRHDTLHTELNNQLSRPRRTSFKPETSRAVFTPHKPTEETSISSGDGRSPSPERPYQGVGKLIDQWQRKTAEADLPRAIVGGKRSGFIIKRAGVDGTTDGGQ